MGLIIEGPESDSVWDAYQESALDSAMEDGQSTNDLPEVD
jgi:hypothetical protein